MTHARFIALFLSGSLLASIAGCNKEPEAEKAQPSASVPAAPASTVAPAEPEPAAPPPSASAAEAEPADSAEEPTAAPKVAKPKFVRGGAVSGTGFSVWLQSSRRHVKGKPSSVQAVLTAKAPFKCNKDYPHKFKGAGGDVTFASSTTRGMNVSPKRSVMNIPFTPNKSGKATVSGVLSFSVCKDDQCLIEKKPLSVSVPVI